MSTAINRTYEAAAKLIAGLKEAGLQADAIKLQAAMDYGSTGTEVCMALRWHLASLLKTDLPDHLRLQAAQLESYLDSALA